MVHSQRAPWHLLHLWSSSENSVLSLPSHITVPGLFPSSVQHGLAFLSPLLASPGECKNRQHHLSKDLPHSNSSQVYSFWWFSETWEKAPLHLNWQAYTLLLGTVFLSSSGQVCLGLYFFLQTSTSSPCRHSLPSGFPLVGVI